MNEIRLTAADIGKRVRLRDGSVTTLIGFNPDARYPFKTSSFQSYTASGDFRAGGGETCMDIVQVLGRKGKAQDGAADFAQTTRRTGDSERRIK